jgi:hypothetical protein
MVGRGLQYATAGSTAGIVLALLAGRWLSTSGFGVQHTSALVIIATAAALASIAAAASWWPGYQAARVPALEAMSVE